MKETPVKQPTKQVTQEPVKQQEQTKTVQEPTKTVQEPVKQVTSEKIEVTEHTTCTTCVKAKPDFSKAIAIAVKGTCQWSSFRTHFEFASSSFRTHFEFLSSSP